MLRQVICSSGNVGRQAVRQNVSSLVLKRNGATVAASQSIQDEWESAKPFEEVPGPKPLPIIGNFWRFLPLVGNISLDLIVQHDNLYKQYGNIYRISHVPFIGNMVFLFNPEDIEKVFRNEGPWPERPIVDAMKYYRNVTRKDLFQGIGGTIVSQGEEWQTFRTKVNPIMMQPRAIKLYVAPIDEVGNDFVKRLRTIRNEKQEMPGDFVDELHKWALESITYIALDTRMGCLGNDLEPDSEPEKILEAIRVIFDTSFNLQIFPLWKLISTPTWKKFVKASDFFNEMCMKYINEARERLKKLPADERELTVLEKLLIRDPESKTAVVMALDMFSAGVETTSYSTALILYLLAKNPDKQEKLYLELRKHMPENNTKLTTEILNEMKYLKSCIKESMRLKPIIPGNVRTLTKDMVLSGYRIPKGIDAVFVNIHACTDEKYFPEPKKFKPERWIAQGNQTRPEAKDAHPFVFMPFGFGARMCLGRRFAELEMEIVLAKLIRNFKIEYNYEEPKFRNKFLYVPSTPMKFTFLDRE